MKTPLIPALINSNDSWTFKRNLFHSRPSVEKTPLEIHFTHLGKEIYCILRPVVWCLFYFTQSTVYLMRVRGGVVAKALCYKPAGRGLVSLEFFSDIILPVALWPLGWLNLYQKWVPGVFPGGKGCRLRTPRVLWQDGGTISPSYWMYMGLRMLGRQKYTQQNH